MSAHEGQPIRVGIVDDQPLLVEAFRALIDHQENMRVVGTAGDGQRALDLCASTSVDVLLMDIRMPRLDGIETARRLTERGPFPRVLVLTTFDLDEYVLGAIGAGASGYLLKDVEPDRLLEAIRAVHRGEAVLANLAAPVVLSRLREADRAQSAAARESEEAQRVRARLTARELDVLGQIGAGATNAEIAQALVIAQTTVKTHVGSLLHKLNARDRVALVIIAHAIGLVGPGSERQTD